MLFECDRAKILIQDFHSHNTGSVENQILIIQKDSLIFVTLLHRTHNHCQIKV